MFQKGFIRVFKITMMLFSDFKLEFASGTGLSFNDVEVHLKGYPHFIATSFATIRYYCPSRKKIKAYRYTVVLCPIA